MLLTRVKSCYYFYYLYDKIIKEWACSMGRVFISYSHKNFEIVSKVNDSLRKNHILTWFDNDDIHDSDYWDTHIKTAIFASNVFLMFYSKEYLASPYCKKEFEIAKSKGNNMKIVVVGLDEASNSYSIDQQIGAIQRIKYSYQTDSDEKLITQIIYNVDHLLFGNKYIYCIGVKYYSLAIDGNYKDVSWFNYKLNGKCKMMKNPLRLNRERVDYFATAITSSKDLFVGMLLVNNSCLITDIKGAGENDLIINIKNLEKTIKTYESRKDVSIIDPDLLNKLVKEINSKCIEK